MSDPRPLDALLDSWGRNNTITINLLRAVAIASGWSGWCHRNRVE